MKCINKSSREYQVLKQRSGLSDLQLSAYCAMYEEKYGRWPYLDELPNCDSSQNMKEELGIRQDGGVVTQKLLDNLGVKTVEEATVKINDTFRDQETNIIALKNESIVKATPRPTLYRNNSGGEGYVQGYVHNKTFFNTTLNKLDKLYGIKTRRMSASEISALNLPIPNAPLAKGFIFNGEIFINTDLATADTPIHELMHLMIGSIRFQDPALYQQLLDTVTKSPDFQQRVDGLMRHRSPNDALEEVLVTELSNYLAGIPSAVSTTSQELNYGVFYNIARMLDSMLMGEYSVLNLWGQDVGNMTIEKIAQVVNSSALNIINPYNTLQAQKHRQVNNRKSELIKDNKLKINC